MYLFFLQISSSHNCFYNLLFWWSLRNKIYFLNIIFEWLLNWLIKNFEQKIIFYLFATLHTFCLVTQLCPTLCNPMDYSLPGSSVHGISQPRILECVDISFSIWSSRPRNQNCVSSIGRRVLYHWTTREAPPQTYIHT